MSNIISEHHLSQISRKEIVGFAYCKEDNTLFKNFFKVNKTDLPTTDVTLILCGDFQFDKSCEQQYLSDDPTETLIFFENLGETIIFKCSNELYLKLFDSSTIHTINFSMKDKTPIFSKSWEKQKIEEYVRMFENKINDVPISPYITQPLLKL